MHFGVRGKLSPRYIGPFDIIECVGKVVYRLALPMQLSNVHNVFHVSLLRKYEPDPSHVLDWKDLVVQEDATFVETPVQILDSKEHVLRGKTIHLVKVLWSHRTQEEATWELESAMKEAHP